MSHGFIKAHHAKVLNEVVDVLIPHYGEMPSATEADVVTVWMDEVLSVRHDLRPVLYRAVRVLQEDSESLAGDRLEYLRSTDEEAFTALGVVVSGAYYLNPDVKVKLGYPGQISRATEYEVEEEPDFVREGLLAPVIQRGPIYRTVSEKLVGER